MLIANICFIVGLIMSFLSLGMMLLCEGKAYDRCYILFGIGFLITEASIIAMQFIGG